MCIFSSPKDNSATIAREQEDQRRARITEGTSSINSAFEGFDDSFFSGIEQSANDFFNPQIDRKFDNARESLIKNLARQGNLNASTGARQLGDLDFAGQEQRASFADKARGFANDSRTDVENNRALILSQLQASADPSAAAATAAAQAQVSDMAGAETGWHRVRNESGVALVLPDVPNYPQGSKEQRAAEDAWEQRSLAMHASQEAITLAPKPLENTLAQRVVRAD